jgi:hypothetical protein
MKVSVWDWKQRWLLISPGDLEAGGNNEQETEMHYIDKAGLEIWQVTICFEGP